MSVYHTEQKRTLIDFMKLNRDKNFTIDEIEAHLLEESKKSETRIAPARSTIYRLIKGLVEEGRIRKFVNSDSRKATYQLIEGEHCDTHLHLKCTDCGMLFHMDERISDQLVRQINSASNFSVDEEETVLYGRCSACNKK